MQICLMYRALCKPYYICFNQINLQTICLPYFSFISRFCYLKGYNFLPILSYLHLHIHILPTVMYKKNTILDLKIFWLIVYMWNLSFYLCVCASLRTQSCPTLCNSLKCCSLPGSSVHGILQARILEWVAISFSRFKQLPITEGRGRWGKGEAAKKQECSLGGQGPGSPPRGTHSNVSLAL